MSIGALLLDPPPYLETAMTALASRFEQRACGAGVQAGGADLRVRLPPRAAVPQQNNGTGGPLSYQVDMLLALPKVGSVKGR